MHDADATGDLAQRKPRSPSDAEAPARASALARTFPALCFVAALSCAPDLRAGCVGFRSERIEDASRSFPEAGAGAARPVDYAIWFPTGDCAGEKVTLRRLAEVAARQRGITGESPDAGAVAELFGLPADTKLPPRFLTDSTAAVEARWADATPGPLVVHVHANALEASLFAERLAARGFHVASLTWRGTHAQAFDVGGSGMMTEVLDAAAVVRDVSIRAKTDVRAFDVVGTSFGAITATCWRGLDSRIRRIVSLDGGIGTRTAEFFLPKCPYLMTSALDVDVLHLYDEDHPAVTLDFVRWLVGDGFVAEPVPLLDHADYHGTAVLRRRILPVEDGAARDRALLEVAGRVADYLATRRAGDEPARK